MALRVVVLVLALAACGTAAAGSPIGRAVAYSNCMRHHGLPTYPDPNKNGNIVITPADHIDPQSPQYRRAAAACKGLAPTSGPGMTPAQQKQALAKMTRYAQCMREHGIPMKNPWTGPNGGVGIALPPSVDPNSQRYRDANTACHGG
jgi:hypothetical protein